MKILIAVDDDEASREALAFAHRIVTESDDVVVLNVTSYTMLIAFGGDRICDTATQHGIELIAIGGHQRGAFARFIHGSVGDYVVHHAPCSVLVAR
jgi:nucleotide-binding universal stress UspA family protein